MKFLKKYKKPIIVVAAIVVLAILANMFLFGEQVYIVN